MEKIINRFEEWQKLCTKGIRGHISENWIQVRIGRQDDPEGDIQNLCYFFPLAAWLHKEGRISESSPLTLDIRFHRDGLNVNAKMKNGDFERVGQFLGFFNTDPCFRIMCNGNTVGKSDEQRDEQSDEQRDKPQVSRIFPLCEIDNTNEEAGYLILKRSSLIRTEELSKQQCDFLNLAERYIDHIKKYDNYVGTTDRSFNKDTKKMLRSMLNSYLEQHLDEMDVLSKIVWMYILKELIEEKLLYTVPENSADSPVIRENVLTKSRMDAIAYGEAMYQLIENACIHSAGKKAWFGIRIHRASKNGTMSRLVKEAQTRSQLHKKYEPCIFENKNDPQHENRWNIFNEDYHLYLEFYVLDSAMGEQLGMVPTYNSTSGKNTENIRDLFDIMPDKTSRDKYIEDVTVHYGLSLLRDIVYANRGYLYGKSPNGKNGSQYYYDGLPHQKNENIYVTEWNALLPISDYWYGTDGKFLQAESAHDIFGNQIEEADKVIYYCSGEHIFRGLFEQDKQEDIRIAGENLGAFFSNIDRNHLERSILVLDVKDNDGYKMEILAKALFAQIVKTNADKKNDGVIPLRIALILPTVNAAHEFVRLFSVFYRRGTQSEMANVQIALCSYKKDDPEALKVDFILAGTSLNDIMENAKAFAYHHTEDSLEYTPLLAYLTHRNSGQAENERKFATPIFPFDLFLTDHMEELNGKKLDINTIWKKSLFTNHINRIINTNLRSVKMGCKLEDIHIRLGSKVHIDTFYEAELLFHDTGNVLRFAYLITQRLLHGDNLLHENSPVLLLGYEIYASSLILQIEYWLKQTNLYPDVYSAIVYNEHVSGRVIVNRNFDKKEDLVDDIIQPVIIVPIGTTLSTLYKIRKAAYNQLAEFTKLKKSDFNWNYCLIVANHSLLSNDAKDYVTSRYWNPDTIDWEKQSITLRHEDRIKPVMQSRYLIAADSIWYDPEHCIICEKYGKKIRPIIDMKYTDPIPGAIFPLLEKREGTFEKLVKDPEVNRLRMQILLGHIQYAHIYSGYNHFQFIFNFRSLFSQNEKIIVNEIKTWKVDPAAFHVLVSPLQMSNSTFVKALIDYVFRGKVRFLRLEFKDTYREEVRAEFSYIIGDFKRLKLSDNKARIYIHYADSSIVMGNTINRARLLVKMLLNQSGIPHEDVELFSKIYLLVNRCSYDTIHYFVRNPAEDLKAFIQLSIPSYNTENDSCPACRLAEKYELLEKRSSTQRISTEFAWLGEKHGKHTREEYDNWIRKAIEEKNSYLGWLKQWLYVNVPSQGEEVLDFLPSRTKEARGGSWYEDWERDRSKERKKALVKAKNVKKAIGKFYERYVYEEGDNDFSEKQQKWLDDLSKICLKDIGEIEKRKDNNTFLDDAVELICSQLIATHDYMRLEAMQKAYEKIEESNGTETGSQYDSVRKIMLKLIADEIIEEKEKYPLPDEITPYEAKRFLLVRNMEWMMSYFKVLAREQISNYYDCRQAIMGIIQDTLNLLNKDRFSQHGKKLAAEDKSWEKIIYVLKECCYGDFSSKEPQLTASLQYQFHAMLLHRMAHLQSMDMTKAKTAKDMVQSYDNLLDRYFSVFSDQDKSGSTRYLELPSRDRFILRYLKSVKTATMTTRDDIPCLMIEKNFELDKREVLDWQFGKNSTLDLIMKYLYLENVKILYYGMRELEDLFPLCDEIKFGRSVDSFVSNMRKLNVKVQEHLQSCYPNMKADMDDEGILYQNSLSVFCRFWSKSIKLVPVSADQIKIDVITYMFHYYRLLSYLSEDRKESFKIDDMPYLYEELCRCMCGVTDAKMCYIAFQSDGDMPEIFTQSGYYSNYISNSHHKILTPQDMELVLRRSCAVWGNGEMEDNEEYEDYMLIPDIAVLSEKEKDRFLVIRIALKDAEIGESYFYIVLQMEENNNVDKCIVVLHKARNILFMREKLQAVLSKDYTILINFRFDCSYIKPYRKDNKETPIVLHISDLHVKGEIGSDGKAAVTNVVERILKRLDDRKVDLLAVTGDLIDGHDASAPKAEQNYQNVAKLLDRIVQELWKDEEGYMPHDWKRRVMIITGNHDYASMNQFQAVLRHRALAAGMPVDGESGTMSKFAYYIDFLIRYLDPPIDQLLNNDLNEIRFYRNLGIKVLMLNLSGLATPRRTNKMGANAEKVKALIKSNLWKHTSEKSIEAQTEPFRLCLTHYPPNYKPDYFLDHYSILPGWEKDPNKGTDNPINKLVQYFVSSVKEKFENKYGFFQNTGDAENGKNGQWREENTQTEKFLEEAKHFKDAMEDLRQNQTPATAEIGVYYKQLIKLADEEQKGVPWNRRVEEIVRKFEQNNLYRQLQSYVNWCEMEKRYDDVGYLQSNEQISKLLSNVYECLIMSKTDEDNYNDLKNEIESKGSIDLYLSGHVHAYQEDKEKKILVADVLYRSKKEEVNGYVVTIQPKSDKKIKYSCEII